MRSPNVRSRTRRVSQFQSFSAKGRLALCVVPTARTAKQKSSKLSVFAAELTAIADANSVRQSFGHRKNPCVGMVWIGAGLVQPLTGMVGEPIGFPLCAEVVKWSIAAWILIGRE